MFLRKYFKPGQTVLDPFCGSGTTLVQANELNINAVGCDVSAFNTLLGRVKTARYDLKLARKEVLDVLEKVRRATAPSAIQLSLWQQYDEAYTDKTTDDDYLQQWYAPQALEQLLIYRQAVKSSGYLYSYHYVDLMNVILSRSARSARLTTHFDLDFPKNPQIEPYWCYKHSRNCQPTTEAYKFLHRYSLDALKRIEAFSLLQTDASVTIHHEDSRNAVFGAVDGLITSPPYVGLIDYHEQHTYAYHLMNLQDRRVDEIGAAANGSSKKAQKQYQEGIAAVLKNASAQMPSGSPIIVVANDRANLYGEIAAMADLRSEAVIQRHVNRRTGRRSGEYFESVFVWRKP